jgi:hypothetical protein
MNDFDQISSSGGTSGSVRPKTSASGARRNQWSSTGTMPLPELKMMSRKQSSWKALPSQCENEHSVR